MFPPFSINYFPYGSAHNAELRGQLFLCDSARRVSASDMPDLLVGEFCSTDLIPAKRNPFKDTERIENIFSWRNPFEIFNPVVRTIAVFVVHLNPLSSIGNKRSKNKAMNQHGSSAKPNLPVSQIISLFKNDALNGLQLPVSPWVFNQTIQRTNRSGAGNLILTLITNNVFPYFYNHMARLFLPRAPAQHYLGPDHLALQALNQVLL